MIDAFTKAEAQEYFGKSIERDAGRPDLPLMSRACSDCAVTGGLYTIYSHALSQLPRETQVIASRKWYCHNCPGKACRGNVDYLGLNESDFEVSR